MEIITWSANIESNQAFVQISVPAISCVSSDHLSMNDSASLTNLQFYHFRNLTGLGCFGGAIYTTFSVADYMTLRFTKFCVLIIYFTKFVF